MKPAILFVLLCICNTTGAQDWFPIGANWYYRQFDYVFGERFKYFEVTGDTLIQGNYCRIVEGECECSDFDLTNYVHQDGNRIYYFDTDSAMFRILYDFGLSPGDTMRYFDANYGDSRFVLDSISLFMAGDSQLRVQHFHQLDGSLEHGQNVYELIGSNMCLYPISAVCDVQTGGLRCYEDTIVGLLKFIDIDIPCDYITTATEDVIHNSIRVFPSPSNGYFIVEAPQRIAHLELINIQTGYSVNHSVPMQFSFRIDSQHFLAGAYALRVRMEDGSVQLCKVVLL
jgi:hypothetical protein